MEIIYQPHIHRELQSLAERIYTPRVCIDNDSYRDCTVIKVDNANKHGILLEMVQVLMDLDLLITKSYVSSDGVWFMEVFYVTDKFGNKLTDEGLILYIQQSLFESKTKREETSTETQAQNGCKSPQNNIALEMTSTDRPGLLSEISAVLLDMGCNVTSVRAWTHNDRAACIIYLEDAQNSRPIKDPKRLAQVEQQLEHLVEACHGVKGGGEQRRRSVRFTTFAAGCTHAERRLHQLMYDEGDYERCRKCHVESIGDGGDHQKEGTTHVSVGKCEDKGYWVVNVRSKDRPKLLFDTVCVLTDMKYVVFHAAIRSKGSMADQEYFVRHADTDDTNNNNSSLDADSERQKLTLCLIAAIERRVSHASLITPSIKMEGLRVDLRTQNRKGLLSDVTRVFRENGLSISRAEVGTQGEKAVGSFYVRDYSGEEVNPNIVELVREETGGSIVAVNKSPHNNNNKLHQTHTIKSVTGNNTTMDTPRRFSLGSMLWSRLSSNLGLIRS